MFLYEYAGKLIVAGTEYLKDYKHAVVFITMPRTLEETRGVTSLTVLI